MDLRHRCWFRLRNKNAKLLVRLIAALQLINDASSQNAFCDEDIISVNHSKRILRDGFSSLRGDILSDEHNGTDTISGGSSIMDVRDRSRER